MKVIHLGWYPSQGSAPGLRFTRRQLDLAAHADPPTAAGDASSPRIVRFDDLGESRCLHGLVTQCRKLSASAARKCALLSSLHLCVNSIKQSLAPTRTLPWFLICHRLNLTWKLYSNLALADTL